MTSNTLDQLFQRFLELPLPATLAEIDAVRDYVLATLTNASFKDSLNIFEQFYKSYSQILVDINFNSRETVFQDLKTANSLKGELSKSFEDLWVFLDMLRMEGEDATDETYNNLSESYTQFSSINEDDARNLRSGVGFTDLFRRLKIEKITINNIYEETFVESLDEILQQGFSPCDLNMFTDLLYLRAELILTIGIVLTLNTKPKFFEEEIIDQIHDIKDQICDNVDKLVDALHPPQITETVRSSITQMEPLTTAETTAQSRISLMPPRLDFGVIDCFHPTLDWRLDSPVISVWIYYDSQTKKPVVITIVGSGLPHLWQRIESMAFNVVLNLLSKNPTLYDHMFITKGFIRIGSEASIEEKESDAEDKLRQILELKNINDDLQKNGSPSNQRDLLKILEDVSQHFKRQRMSNSMPLPENISTFATNLMNIANETGFVRITKASHEDFDSFTTNLSNLLKAKEVTIISPSTQHRIVSEFPLCSLPYSFIPLELHLPDSVVKNPEFKTLILMYYRYNLTKIIGHLKRRIDFWRERLVTYYTQMRDYNDLPPEKKKNHPPVMVQLQIDPELCLLVPTEPKPENANDYYNITIPDKLIPQAKKEIKKQREKLKPIKILISSRSSLLWRKCFSEVFDCAIRGIPLAEDFLLQQIFVKWTTKINERIWELQSQVSEELNINREDIFKRTSIFRAELDAEHNRVNINPNVVIDTARSTIIIDQSRKILVIKDPLDDAKNIDLDQLSKPPSRINNKPTSFPEIEFLLSETKRVFDQPELLDNVLNTLFLPGEIGKFLNQEREKVRYLAEKATAGRRSYLFRLQDASNTAVEILNVAERVEWNKPIQDLRPQDPSGLFPSKALTIALLQCLASGISHKSFNENLQILLKDPRNTQILKPIKNVIAPLLAIKSDIPRKTFEKYLEDPEKPKIDEDVVDRTPLEDLCWQIEHCIESMKLCRLLIRGNSSLRPSGETVDTVFLALEEFYENMYNSLFNTLKPNIMNLKDLLLPERRGSW